MTQAEMLRADYELMGEAYTRAMKHIDLAVWCIRCGRMDLALVALHQAQAHDRGVMDSVPGNIQDELDAMYQQACAYDHAS